MSLDIRDRIVEFTRIKASELTPHPQNWRKHPKEQREAISGILAEVGYVDALMVRKHEGGYQIIDGHLRAETTPDATVPVLVVDLDDSETELVLATFDPLAALAKTNDEKLGELLDALNTDNAALQSMFSDLLDTAPDGVDAKKMSSLPQAIQLEPSREYVVVMCNDDLEWERLKVALSLGQVRRGGFKEGSQCESVSTQRVVMAKDLLLILSGD